MKSFKLLTSFFFGISLTSSPLLAHSYKGEVIPQICAPHNWTGFYAGVNAGFVQQTMDITNIDATTFNATLVQQTNPRLTGGLQIGYRKQIDMTRTSAVYGAELSANFSDASFSKTYGGPFALYQLDSDHNLKDVVLLQLMDGLAIDKTLLFLSAGAAWTRTTGTTTNISNVPFFTSFSVNKNQLSPAIGAGIEYAFTDKISARFKLDYIPIHSYSTSDDIGDSFEVSSNIVQATIGVNYVFAC